MLVFLVLTVLVALLSAVPIRASAAREADLRMAQIREATQVPLSPSATARLRPVVIRRTSWPAIGRSVGLVVALSGFLFLTGALEGRLFSGSSLLVGLAAAASTAFGLAAGGLVCHLAVGLHGFPPDASTRRTVRLSARRITDYVSRARLEAWRWSTLGLVVTLALGLALLDPGGGAGSVLVAGFGAVVLAGVSLVVRRVLLGRPMPGGSREVLVWEEALLGDSLQLITTASAVLNATAMVLGLGAVIVLREDLAAWGPPVAGLVTALALVVCAALARRLLRDDRPPVLQVQDLAT